VTRRLVNPLGRNPWFFICILAAFAAEWLLRKVWGLV
jgi:hypothetical protein